MPPGEEKMTARLFDDADAGALDPLALFDAWLAAAEKAEPADPNAMALATVDAAGMPDCRIVLLKARDETGFVFFTNTGSGKASELAAAPRAALTFYWKSLGRQVHVRGPVAPVSAATADAYFATRPRGSQIGAHASDQSRPLASRAELVARVEKVQARFAGAEVPRPPHWSGYAVAPLSVEFWRSSEFRLHDRVRFTRPSIGAEWRRQRLFP